jgi:hypothetical protein
MQLLRALRPALRPAFCFATEPLRTETFRRFSDKQLATPEMVRLELIRRIPLHSRLSQVSLYHGKRVRHAIKTCFSEKKYPPPQLGPRSSNASTNSSASSSQRSSTESSSSASP